MMVANDVKSTPSY